MKTTKIELKDEIEKLLLVLDNDIRHIGENLSMLDEMRSLIVKRDEASLNNLIQNIQSKVNNYKDNELNRQLLQKKIAIIFDCHPSQITLSSLEAKLTGQIKNELMEKKDILQKFANKLKKEHTKTTMLLSDCIRFNNVLLKSIFESRQSKMITYNPNGSAEQHINSAFVNYKF
jgi:hypothetical protein